MSFSHLTFLYADVVRDILVQDSFIPAENDDVIDLTDIELWIDADSVAADSSISEDGTRPESANSYHARLRNDASITRTFETGGRQNIQLKYFWQGDADADEETDVLSVYWKKTSESEFILLETRALDSTTWSEVILDLPEEADDTSIDIQFVGNTNSDEEEVRVDDVSLEGAVLDRDAPLLAETTPVNTPSKDRTPDVTIYTTEGASISITGHCRSSISDLLEGDNTFHLLFEEEVEEMHYFKIDEMGSFPDGYFSNCIVTVTDAAGNISLPLSLTPFFVDGTAPEITVEPYTTTPTNVDITVTASTNEGILNTTTHTFTENGSFTFTATDDAGNITDRVVTITNIDKTAPQLEEITPISTVTNDSTPTHTFSSSEVGTLTYGGDCSSSTVSAVAGDNTITFDTLPDGVYDDCTITITDDVGFTDTLSIPSFTIDTTLLVVSDLNSVTFVPPGVTLTWITNKPATTRIEYGMNTSYGTSIIVETESSTSHTATITGLTAGTTYHYRFISTDTIGTMTMSEDATFTIPGTVNNNAGSSGGSFVAIVSVPVEPVETPIFTPLPDTPESPEDEIPTPIIPPISPVTPSTPISPNIPEPIDIPAPSTAPIFEGGGVTPNQIDNTTFIPTSVPVDIGGGVMPEDKSYNFLWIFLILFGALNYWWFFIAKKDEEDEEEKNTIRRRKK